LDPDSIKPFENTTKGNGSRSPQYKLICAGRGRIYSG